MSWFKVVSKGKDKAELYILDQIGKDWWTGDGTVAAEFIDAVKALGDFESADLYINSPGGDVGDGLTIANFIREHPAKFTAKVTGRAASIASVIACACNEVVMFLGSTMLVHKPSAFAGSFLTADGFRKYADALDVYEEGIIDFYMERVGNKEKGRDELSSLLREDRVMTASEAIEWGFADSEDAELKAVACASMDAVKVHAYNSAALSVKDSELVDAKNKITELERTVDSLTPKAAEAESVLAECSKAGLDFMAHNLVASKTTSAELKEIINKAKDIAAVCKALGVNAKIALAEMNNPSKMIGLVANEALSALEQDQDSSLTPGAGSPAAKAPDAKAVYSQLNNKGN